mmetsp:Transcript_9112/g.25439  ORF Transcript_9112/g.25439 Transcript_9112/m.25439 type:complete len:366 (-) Transcript_9112:43-1140(-)|eukprot:CAMPEP_0194556936 /NCGR_PEP_ID=MMETSP0253-20130528/98993_1 /TAXON_ID=2966 /ORGANISM="Noctiluca scintillans" /LENGTH=365 /DNA_ID=CAMNT_0039404441 /DNA_START=25 /DNA_END=1122 /DNA_ORIENTATION=-
MTIEDLFARFACPQKLLLVCRFHVAVAGASVILLFVLANLFANGVEVADQWTVIVAFCLLTDFVRLTSVVLLERRARSIRDDFVLLRSVDRAFSQLFSSCLYKLTLAMAFVSMWNYFYMILWTHQFPPCNDPSRVVSDTDPDPLTEACEVCEFVSMFFTLTNALFALLSLHVAVAHRHFSSEVVPPSGGAVPVELLQWMPVFEFGSQEPSPRQRWSCEEGKSCTVCMCTFEQGDRVRRLFCGHDFHADCVDGWLARSCACPLRCNIDLQATAMWYEKGEPRLVYVGGNDAQETTPQHTTNSVLGTNETISTPPCLNASSGVHHDDDFPMQGEALRGQASDEEAPESANVESRVPGAHRVPETLVS